MLQWTTEEKELRKELKQGQITAPVLALPALKPFQLFVTVDRGAALGVLTQEWGHKRQPVAYLSKLIDPVSQGWPEYIQAVAATALRVEESRKLTFGRQLVVTAPDQVRTILTQKLILALPSCMHTCTTILALPACTHTHMYHRHTRVPPLPCLHTDARATPPLCTPLRSYECVQPHPCTPCTCVHTHLPPIPAHTHTQSKIINKGPMGIHTSCGRTLSGNVQGQAG